MNNGPTSATVPASSAGTADDLLVVDCLLPGQVRRLGQRMSYIAARQALKTTVLD